MKLILDQGLPRSTVMHLAASGIAAEHVGELGMATSTDAEILETARVRSAAVVSLDADFHRLLAIARATSPSVIRIRVEGMKGDELAKTLAAVVSTAGAELSRGAVVSVTKSRIRVRLLPIG